MMLHISPWLMQIATLNQTDPSFWDRFTAWANITEPWEVGLVAFGLGAQVLFFCRWIVQWYASEKRGESHRVQGTGHRRQTNTSGMVGVSDAPFMDRNA